MNLEFMLHGHVTFPNFPVCITYSMNLKPHNFIVIVESLQNDGLHSEDIITYEHFTTIWHKEFKHVIIPKVSYSASTGTLQSAWNGNLCKHTKMWTAHSEQMHTILEHTYVCTYVHAYAYTLQCTCTYGIEQKKLM